MLSKKDYSQMTPEELLAEKKKLSTDRISAATILGFLVGIAIYGAVKGSFILTVILLLIALRIGVVDTQNRKNLQAEIAQRNKNQ